MLNFVPNIIVLEYLTVLGKLTPEIALKAKKYMETGYQRELTYKHNNGSYSAFGKSDRCGSTWLTAFVAKSFHQASKHIQIEEENTKQALKFLSKVQDENGSFKENGTVIHTDMQGGSSKGLGLTAYVLITFLENQNEIQNYQTTIKRALDFIIANSKDLDDNYSLAITTYALQLAQHTLKDSLLLNLNNKADNENGFKHWIKSVSKSDEKSPWNDQPNAVNIEMTAYALQAFIEAGKETESVPILKWLVTQRNENGGFQSTQDTVVGLQALSKLAAKMYVADSQVDIAVKHGKGSSTKLSVNEENALVLQKHELPSDVRDFEVSATGKGFSVLQFSYKYNINETGEWPRFILEPKLNEDLNKNVLNLTVATNYVADVSSQKSNMAVLEVSFPSGYTFDSDHLSTLKAMQKVKVCNV
jgi:CD109 antigen